MSENAMPEETKQRTINPKRRMASQLISASDKKEKLAQRIERLSNQLADARRLMEKAESEFEAAKKALNEEF